jgi:hypothetical protein
MSDNISNLQEAINEFQHSLIERGLEIDRIVPVRVGNSQVWTKTNEIFHVKFTKKPFTPDPNKTGPARELHLKLQFAMSSFSYRSNNQLLNNEQRTMVGIDEDLLLGLIENHKKGYKAFIVTILARGLLVWLQADDFYEFVMRYDTFIKFPRSGTPVCYVPTGYFFSWTQPKIFFPAHMP